MNVHLYLSLIPEVLIASNLPPAKFGQYYATGHKRKWKGQSIFVEVDRTFRHPAFDLDEAFKRCVPHPDGSPKNSVYVSVYRVLEHIPVSAMDKLYLATAYGATMGIERGSVAHKGAPGLHLYEDLAPVNSLVVSTLDPVPYYERVTTKPTKFIKFPALAFVELGLGALADDPENGAVGDLPYPFIHHLREALIVLDPKTKDTKLVHRVHSPEFPYRMVKGGFYIGNGPDLAYYPMPAVAELRRDHATWWRSANML